MPVNGTNRSGQPMTTNTHPRLDIHSARSDVRSLGVLGRAWVVGIVAFSAARALLAWPTLGQFGVNPWVFLFIDLTTAIPYGLGQAVTVKVLRDPVRRTLEAVPWATLVTVSFLAPYLYVFWVSKESMPAAAYVVVLAWMVFFGVLAVLRIRNQVSDNTDS